MLQPEVCYRHHVVQVLHLTINKLEARHTETSQGDILQSALLQQSMKRFAAQTRSSRVVASRHDVALHPRCSGLLDDDMTVAI